MPPLSEDPDDIEHIELDIYRSTLHAQSILTNPLFHLMISYVEQVQFYSQSVDGSSTVLEDDYVLSHRTTSYQSKLDKFVLPDRDLSIPVTRQLLQNLELSDIVPESMAARISSYALEQARTDPAGIDLVSVQVLLMAVSKVVYEEADWRSSVPEEAMEAPDWRSPASEEATELAVKEEVSWEGGEDGCKCTICMEEFVIGERVVKMPCNHCFHKGCIVQWLTQWKNSCPVCRFKVAQ